MTQPENPIEHEDLAAVERLTGAFETLRREMGKVIVGQQEVLEELLVAIFARGHCLLIGVPGLAKTLMIHTLADALNLSFNRIQFTPDLMPSDITGTEVIQEDKATGTRQFKFLRGPIFANLILADEINRTPPKTQAALLEAMQERQATVGGERHRLPDPFFVLATQNPIEQEGTYPLPEAQLDRFMFNILVDYPSEDEELEVVRVTTSSGMPSGREGALGGRHPGAAEDRPQGAGRRAHRPLRRPAGAADPAERAGGAGLRPRLRQLGGRPAGQPVPRPGGQGPGVLHGRTYVATEDIRVVSGPVLRHRIVTNFNAEAEGLRPDDLIRRLIQALPADPNEATERDRLPKLFRSADAG